MLGFILRRLGVLAVILFGSSFILFNLTAISGDPLEGLKFSLDPKAKALIATLTRELMLDTPPPIRYFYWLKGVVIGDFGMTREAQSVGEALANAIPTTLRLVFFATIIAIILGIGVGIVTALRQYSRFDYTMTFVAFLLFSLPIFWVAVLLKQYLAIEFNNFLAEPIFSIQAVILASLVSGFFWMGVIGGERKRLVTTFLIAAAATFGFMWFVNATEWLADPYLGPIGVLVLSVGIAFGITQLSMGIGHKPSLYSALTMAGIGFALYFPMQTVFEWENRKFLWPGLVLVTIVVAVVTGLLFAKIDRGPVIRTAILTALPISGLLVFDKLLRSFNGYTNTDAIFGRPIPTAFQYNELLGTGNFWYTLLDILLHMALPTLALLLISFAGYIRYARGTLLEVLNQDYIRTARAKGLPERTVIMRHAFRNTMIPLTTIMVVDFAGIIGGAIITEQVFGWKGMGTLFNQAINTFDLNLLMGVFFVTATMSVVANLIADLLYGALDPRIRVGGGK